MGFFTTYLRSHFSCTGGEYDILPAFKASDFTDQATAEKVFREDIQKIKMWSPGDLQRWASEQTTSFSCLKKLKYQEYWTNMNMDKSLNAEIHNYYQYRFEQANQRLRVQDGPCGSAVEPGRSQEQKMYGYNEAEHDNGSVDIEFASDLSEDHHPLVNGEEYTLQAVDPMIEKHHTRAWLYKYDTIEDTSTCDVLEELHAFRTISFKLEPKGLSDLRLLALNHTYLFTEDIKESVTSYLPQSLHTSIMKDVLNEPVVSLSDRTILWCMKLSQIRLSNWFEIQKITIPFLNDAITTVDTSPVDLIVANILHRSALLFSNGPPNSTLEDSLVHNFIAGIFENIFMSDSVLNSDWADGQLGSKRNNSATHFKPDYVIYLTQRSHRLDLSCAEAKLPDKVTTFPKSDLVKLGQEMRWMLNRLIREGVAKPVVGGILVSGFRIQTFKMELTDNSIYQMVQLGDVSLFKNISELTLLPRIVSNLLQLKNVILKTAKKANERLCDKAKGAPPTNEPPVSWTRDNDFDLVKRQKTKK